MKDKKIKLIFLIIFIILILFGFIFTLKIVVEKDKLNKNLKKYDNFIENFNNSKKESQNKGFELLYNKIYLKNSNFLENIHSIFFLININKLRLYIKKEFYLKNKCDKITIYDIDSIIFNSLNSKYSFIIISIINTNSGFNRFYKNGNNLGLGGIDYKLYLNNLMSLNLLESEFDLFEIDINIKSLENILYLLDLKYKGEMNKVIDEYFHKDENKIQEFYKNLNQLMKLI